MCGPETVLLVHLLPDTNCPVYEQYVATLLTSTRPVCQRYNMRPGCNLEMVAEKSMRNVLGPLAEFPSEPS